MVAHADSLCNDPMAGWLRYLVRRGFAVNTRQHRVGLVRRWFAYIGDDWRDATFRDVEAFAADLGVSASSQRAHLSHLRAFYRWARREGIADHNPVDLVDLPRVGTRLPRPAPDDAIAHVLAVSEAPLAAMVGVMATAGLRCCEIAALRWRDVDLGRGEAIVLGKGDRERVCYLTRDAVVLLAALDDTDGHVWRSPHRIGNPPYSPHRVSQMVARAFTECGYPYTAHQLRHRAGTVALAAAEGDLLAVRDMLGHASVATTQIYTRVVSARTAAVARSVRMPT
jgi:site-specific recombinase XerD